jgi:hypothetical protein
MFKEKNTKPNPIELSEFLEMLTQDGWTRIPTLNYFDVGDIEREHNWLSLESDWDGDPEQFDKFGDQVRWGSHTDLGMDVESGREFCEKYGLKRRDLYYEKGDDSISFFDLDESYTTEVNYVVLYNDGDQWTPKCITEGPLYYYQDFLDNLENIKNHLDREIRKKRLQEELETLK